MFLFFCFSEQIVFAKREIPLEMKFGPYVGDTKTLNKHEIKLYRESNVGFPFLFLSHNSILDVSNESKEYFFKNPKKLFDRNLCSFFSYFRARIWWIH